MSDNAWVVPVHPPHFDHVMSLVEGTLRFQIDIDVYAVTSFAHEVGDLEATFAANGVPSCHILAASHYLSSERMDHYAQARSIINVKKFVGLHALRNRYALISTLDAETAVLRSGTPGTSYQLRAERKAWPAHRCDEKLIREIIAAPMDFFSPDQREVLREATLDGSLYSWFEDIPTYDSEILRHFFKAMGADTDLRAFCDRLRWHDFDYILYQYFCMVHLGWRLHDLGWPSPAEDGCYAWWEMWSLHQPADRHRAAEFAAAWQPSWVKDAGMAAGDVPSAYLAFHQDRR